jgi:hypothetical protein
VPRDLSNAPIHNRASRGNGIHSATDSLPGGTHMRGKGNGQVSGMIRTRASSTIGHADHVIPMSTTSRASVASTMERVLGCALQPQDPLLGSSAPPRARGDSAGLSDDALAKRALRAGPIRQRTTSARVVAAEAPDHQLRQPAQLLGALAYHEERRRLGQQATRDECERLIASVCSLVASRLNPVRPRSVPAGAYRSALRCPHELFDLRPRCVARG